MKTPCVYFQKKVQYFPIDKGDRKCYIKRTNTISTLYTGRDRP